MDSTHKTATQGTAPRAARNAGGALRALLARAASALFSNRAVLAGAALILLAPLLLSPGRFPAAGSREAAARAIAGASARARWERASGEIPYFASESPAEQESFYTHPLYYAISRMLPPGISLTLVALIHALLLSLGMEAFARRMGFGRGSALLAGAVALAGGAVLQGLASPEGLASAAPAALAPPLALLGRALYEAPTAPRVAAAALLVALAASGAHVPSLLIGLALAAAGAWILRDAARTERRAAVSTRGRAAGRWGALALALGLGLALAAYRTLPAVRSIEWSDALGLSCFAPAPWWRQDAGHLRLPFFLGVTALVALAAGVAGQGRKDEGDRRARRAALLAAIIAALAPRELLAFVSLPLALACAAGAGRLQELLPARAPVAMLLAAVLALEAVPYHRSKLAGLSEEEIAAAPRWVQFLGAACGPERVEIPDADAERLAPALAVHGVLRASGAGEVLASSAAEEHGPRAAAFLDARYKVLPSPRRSGALTLAHADRAESRYVYLNLSRLGPAYWTQRVEIHAARPPDQGRAPLLPLRRGAVALSAEDGAVDLPGDGFGPLRIARRTPNGLHLVANVPGEAYVVITEPYRPEAQAFIDGRPARLLRANGAHLAMPVAAGRHQIELRYRPAGLAAGAAISTLAAALLPILFAAPLLAALAARGRRGRGKPAPLIRSRRKAQRERAQAVTAS